MPSQRSTYRIALVSTLIALTIVVLLLGGAVPAGAEPIKPNSLTPTGTPPAPTAVPTDAPTSVPTTEPTPIPTLEPTPVPTTEPTPVPSDSPIPTPVPPTATPGRDRPRDTPPPAPTATPVPSPPPPANPPPAPAPVTEVSIVKRSDQAMVRPGDRLIYTLVARNTGTTAARDVVVTDTVPEALEVIDLHSTKGEIVVRGQTVTAYPAVLEPGEIVTVTITTRVRGTAQPGEVTNRAVITTSTDGDQPGDNTSTVTTRIDPPAAVPPASPPASAPPASARPKVQPKAPPAASPPVPAAPVRQRITTQASPSPVLPATGDPWGNDPLLLKLFPWGLLGLVLVGIGIMVVRTRRGRAPLAAAGMGAPDVGTAPAGAVRRRLAPSAEQAQMGGPLPPGRAADALPPPAALDRPGALRYLREE